MVREELLIVGLGNPESEYADTRHNLGFACLHELARRLGVTADRSPAQLTADKVQFPSKQAL